MPTLTLPAVRAGQVHGWFPLLGAARILGQQWPGLTLHMDSETPVFDNGPASIDEAADAIHTATIATIPPGGVLPGVDPAYPPPGRDGIWWRQPSGNPPPLLTDNDALPWPGDAEVWRTAMTGQSGLLHPMISPHAAQTVRSMLAKPGEALRRDPGLLRAALTRIGLDPTYPGGLWLQPAAQLAERPAASPGRDWLAIMALPWMPAVEVYVGLAPYTDRRCAPFWRWRLTGRPQPQLVCEWWLWSKPIPVTQLQHLILHHPAYLLPFGRTVRCGARRAPRGHNDPPRVQSLTVREIADGALDDVPAKVRAARLAGSPTR